MSAARLALWGLLGASAASAVLGGLSLSARAALELGRERLLAGDLAAADAALRRASRWPPTAAASRGGLALVAAARGRAPQGPVALHTLVPFDPPGLVEAAIEDGNVSGARILSRVLVAAGHPLGRLYAAALELEAGDPAAARRIARSTPVPLECRRLGARLAHALAGPSAEAGAPVRDRNGVLVGVLASDGRVSPPEGLRPLVGGYLDRIRVTAETEESAGRRHGSGGWPTPGVRLGIDLDLSRLALEALGSERGTIVLLEPRSGDVLTAVSDARTAASDEAAAFDQRREPASIAKLLTTSAAYRAGLDADAEIGRMTCTGVERYGGQPLWCPFPAGPLSGLDEALAVSCNIAFANLAVRVGREALLDEYRRWGFDAGERVLLGAAGRVETPPRTPRQLADLGIGLTLTDVTPLHAALLAAVVADGGWMPEPRLLVGRCGRLGLVDRPGPRAAPREVVATGVASRLHRAMEAVAAYGTGEGLAPAGLRVAMKTGTAATPREGYHVNYVGFAPSADPTVAFCVRLTHQRSSRAVNAAAREVARRLLAGLADRRQGLARAARRQRRLAGL